MRVLPLILLAGCAECAEDGWSRFFAVHVIRLERPVEATVGVDLGREHYDCTLTMGDDEGNWGALTEDCPGSLGAYFVNENELGVVLPLGGVPQRATVVFEAVGEDGVPYGFQGDAERVDWQRTGAICSVQGEVWYTQDGALAR